MRVYVCAEEKEKEVEKTVPSTRLRDDCYPVVYRLSAKPIRALRVCDSIPPFSRIFCTLRHFVRSGGSNFYIGFLDCGCFFDGFCARVVSFSR